MVLFLALLFAMASPQTHEAEKPGLPLEIAQVLEFEVDEGTWMSLDVSPDGETWALASGGLTEHQTLRAVTLHGAEAIGLDADVGSIEAGKLADILVLDRNPLEKIENTGSVRYVMKNGDVFEAATLDQIWPVRKALPKQFWWDDVPTPAAATHGGAP